MPLFLFVIRIWNWHLYVYEDDSLRLINWRGKTFNFHLRDIKEIEKKYNYYWHWSTGAEERCYSVKIKDFSGKCLCLLDPDLDGFDQFELWAREKGVLIKRIEKIPLQKKSYRKYYFGYEEADVLPENNIKLLKTLRTISIIFPIGYFVMYLYALFTWKDITWIHIIYSLTVYALCVVYHQYISAETPPFLEKTKYQQWRKTHVNFLPAMLITAYYAVVTSDFWSRYYVVIKGNCLLLSAVLFLIMAAVYFYFSWKDSFANHIVMVLFLLFFCGTISKPFLMSFMDSTIPNPGYGIVVEKQTDSGEDWIERSIDVELDTGKTVTFKAELAKTYEKSHINGPIQLVVWDVPFGFEIASLAEYP